MNWNPGSWPTWALYAAPIGALLGFALVRSSWVYHRYGKAAEKRCENVRRPEAHGRCVARQMRKMGYGR
ncbi:MAG: hypothetical protein ACRD1X_17995 [Vicinamibacteria bacterium]